MSHEHCLPPLPPLTCVQDPQHLHYLSGQSLFAALEKVRHALEKKNRRDLTKIANMKSEDEEDEKKVGGGCGGIAGPS